MKTITAKIKLDPSQLEILSEELKRRQMSIEELLNNMVRQYLDEICVFQTHHQVDFMSIVGLGDSGESDISDNHDKHLGEAIANEHLR